MTGKPRGFSEAIEELEKKEKHANGGADLRDRVEHELRRVEELLKNVKPHLDELSQKVSNEAKKAKHKVEDKVAENPWAALGVVGLLFLVLGFLLGWSSRRKD